MTDAQRIVIALQKLLDNNSQDDEPDSYDQGYADGLRDALSKAQSISEGF